MSVHVSYVFFTSASQAQGGAEYVVPGLTSPLSKVYVSLSPMSGATASRTVAFEGMGPAGSYLPIYSSNMSSNVSASQTIGIGSEIWAVPLAGMDTVRCRLVTISGSCTAIGKVVL